MRTKAVPGPVSMDALVDAQRAVPLVPEPTDDCCGHLQARGPATTRDSARDWIAFLAALDLLAEGERGYQRYRVDPTDEPLAERFRERVYGVKEAIAVLEEGATTVEGIFEATRSMVPTWERNRHPDWEATWRDRTERLLAWAVLFGLCSREGDRFDLA